MKTGFARPARVGGIACAVAAVALPALFTASAEEGAVLSSTKRPEIHFTPVHIKRNPDGSPKRSPQSAVITKNWSGYIVRGFQTGELYTSASANWTVPTVTYYQNNPGFALESSASWVGIGGACADASYLTQAVCDDKDRTLIQVVTAQKATPTGTEYVAKYEMLPAPAVTIPITINPGDRIAASVQCIANCSNPATILDPTQTQTWTLSLSNETTGSGWQQIVTYASRELSAEWIEEAPTQTGVGILPLAYFDIANFGPHLEANGKVPKLSVSENGFEMQNPYGLWANPSDAERGQNGEFNVCWYNADPSGTDCLVP